jgi:hypothetical protein
MIHQKGTYFLQKILKRSLFIGICFLLTASTQSDKQAVGVPYLALYDTLMQDIEAVDADAIYTRNTFKQINWNQYKAYFREKIAKNPCDEACFNEVMQAFGAGIVNLHAQLYVPRKNTISVSKDSVVVPTVKLTFDYPDYRLYETKSGQRISKINGKRVEDILFEYTNYGCGYSSRLGCLADYVARFNSGRITVNGQLISSLEFVKGEVLPVKVQKIKRTNPGDAVANYITKHPDWAVVAKGTKIVLLRKQDALLLKIIDFNYSDLGGDIRCDTEAKPGTLCADVQLIKKAIIAENKATKLLIDVQNNPGGSENSAFIQLLAQTDFFDNAVAFRKTEALENESIRSVLFYNSERLESWYREYSKTDSYMQKQYGELLDPVADFCRASPTCLLLPMKPDGVTDKLQITVLTNYRCVSSCDDFVWRMKAYSRAKIVGQPHAADGTYSRITLAYHQAQDGGGFKRTMYGAGEPVDTDKLILRITLPATASLDRKGARIQGKPVRLDQTIPITQYDFEDREKATLTNYWKRLYPDDKP